MNKNGGKMMNTKGLWMVVVLFLLLSVTGVLCWDFKTNQHLGTPGVRIVAGNLYNEKSELVRTNIVELPLVVPGFRSEPLPLNTREQEWLPDDTLYGRRRYFSLTDSFFGDLNVVVMERDRTSIHKPQYCLPAGGFHITSEETIELPVTLEDGTQLQAQLIRASREMEIKPGEKRVVNAMFIYYFVADEYRASGKFHSLQKYRWVYPLLFIRCLPLYSRFNACSISLRLYRTLPPST